MIKLTNILQKITLREMSEGLLKKMVALYQPQTTDPEEQIIANLKRFEQLGQAIAKKLQDQNPVLMKVLPDELKSSSVIRDITKYKDYNTLVKVLKAADTKSVDPYKQAIELYKKQNQYLEPRTIGNYVARFKQNLSDLEQKVNDKDEVTLENIPKELLKKDMYKNILNWRSFTDLEHMLDAVFPLENVGGEESGDNDASTNADLIYEKDGIEVYIGDEEHKCIKYSKGYSWCIGRTMYSSYRYQQSQGQNRLFYFVFDRNEPKDNKWHVVVIHVTEKGLYMRTSSRNDGDEPWEGTTWEKLGNYFPGEDGKRFWNRIKGLKDLFKFKNPNKDELRRLGFRGKKLTLDAFADLEPEDKRDWLRANATDNNIVTSEIVKSLPNTGEPSKNDLINYGRVFTFDELKSSAPLLKRYAEYSLVHRKNEILPVQFIPYLKPETQERYYNENVQKFLNYDFIKKYFGEDRLKQYVEKEAENYNYLPKKALTLIPNNLKPIYSTIFKFQENWVEHVNETEEILKAEEASVDPIRLTYKQYISIPKPERDNIIRLAEQNVSENIRYSIPSIFYDNSNTLYLLPISVQDSAFSHDGQWVLINNNDEIIKKLPDVQELEYNNEDLFNYENDKNTRIHSLKNLKLNKLPIPLREIDSDKYILQRKAGIIK